MIYLTFGYSKVMLFLTSILMLPLTIGSLFFCIRDKSFTLLNMSVICGVIYAFILFALWIYAKLKKYTLKVENGNLVSTFPNSNSNDGIQIAMSSLIKIEFCRLFSCHGFVALLEWVAPESAIVTFEKNGKEESMLLGYPKLRDLKEFCTTHNIELVVK